MVFVVIWLLCGLIAAMIGAKKGEGCLSFIVGIMFGPFGVLAAIFSKGDRKTCPFCRELIHNKASVCSHCRRNV